MNQLFIGLQFCEVFKNLRNTPAKSFGKRFGMWAICYILSNVFYEVSK